MEAVVAQTRDLIADHALPVIDKLRPLMAPVYHGHLLFQDFLSTDHNAIPHMAWEEALAQTTRLSVSQLRFTLALFAAIILAAGVRLFRNPTMRHLYAVVTGVLIVYYPFGSGIIHVLPMAVAAYLALLLAPRRAGTIAWCTVFPYLIYLHVTNASGESWKTGNLDFTGGAMVAVLKLVALCVCRQDSFRKNKEDLNSYQAAHQLTKSPSLLEFLSYLFMLGNLVAGPFVEFSEYKDFMELKGPWDLKSSQRMPNPFSHGTAALLEALLYMFTYLALTLNGWDMRHYNSAWYYSQPLLIKCATFCLIGLVYQLRYYFSWKVTESAYAFAGLDYMGRDPVSDKPLWGRCRNCSFLGVWLSDSARNVPFNWNSCTGNFLRRYVYERIAPRNRRPGFQSLLFTQCVSAIWHGLYPGYLMFFVGTAVWIYFSQVLYKAETYMPAFFRNSLPYRAVKTVWTGFVLNYMASAFQLLDFHSCSTAYGSVYYFPFIVMLVVNVLFSFLKAKRPPKLATGPGGAVPPENGNGSNSSGSNGKGKGSPAKGQ